MTLLAVLIWALHTDTLISLDVIFFTIDRPVAFTTGETLAMINLIIIHNKLDVGFNHLIAVVAHLGVLLSVTRLANQLSAHLMELFPSQGISTFTAAEAFTMIGFTFIVN